MVTSTSKGKALSDTEKKAHWNAGICFICNKKGHLSTGCLERKKPVTNVEKVSSNNQTYETSSSDSEN
jgi:hypothetical protein